MYEKGVSSCCLSQIKRTCCKLIITNTRFDLTCSSRDPFTSGGRIKTFLAKTNELNVKIRRQHAQIPKTSITVREGNFYNRSVKMEQFSRSHNSIHTPPFQHEQCDKTSLPLGLQFSVPIRKAFFFLGAFIFHGRFVII